MKKEELMKQYEELKGKGKEPEMIFLYIHMPTGETETIFNPNVEEKMKYIDRTYNEDLVHANCKDIYIEQACICADFGPTMMFSDAYMLMKQGAKVKLPNWGGYWYWDAEKKTIMMVLMSTSHTLGWLRSTVETVISDLGMRYIQELVPTAQGSSCRSAP